MEPTVQPQPSPLERSPRAKWPRKKLITVIVVGVLVLLGISVLIGQLSKKDSPSGSDNASVYYDRAGYDRSELGSGVGDPMALKMASAGQPVSYKGKTVIQACNLLTLSDLAKNDLLLKANTLPSVVARAYNDGAGKAAYDKVYGSSLSSFGLGVDVNNCHYGLENKTLASISMSVFQPFAVPANVVEQEIEDNYTAAGTVEGMKYYASKRQAADDLPGETATSDFMVVKPDHSGFLVSMKLPSDQEGKKQALLKTIAANFVRESNSPTAPAVPSYDSPVFSKSYARACDLLTNGDIRTLSGRDASPLVLEGIASSVGVIQYGASQDSVKKYTYISNECTRTTTGGGLSILGGGAARLKVATSSYLDETPASAQIAAQKQTGRNNTQNSPVNGVGDEAVAYLDATGNAHLLFRTGRIVTDVSLDKITQRQLKIQSLSTAASKLTPLAQTMAGRVKS